MSFNANIGTKINLLHILPAHVTDYKLKQNSKGNINNEEEKSQNNQGNKFFKNQL